MLVRKILYLFFIMLGGMWLSNCSSIVYSDFKSPVKKGDLLYDVRGVQGIPQDGFPWKKRNSRLITIPQKTFRQSCLSIGYRLETNSDAIKKICAACRCSTDDAHIDIFVKQGLHQHVIIKVATYNDEKELIDLCSLQASVSH